MGKDLLFSDCKTPIGELRLGSLNDQLCMCDWKFRKMRPAIDQRLEKLANAQLRKGKSPVHDVVQAMIEEYFDGKRHTFDLPLLLLGTPFQIKVWEQLQSIPYGKTQSYLGLAKDLGDPKAIRAVATANGANAISILVPCHRIIGSDGALTGYAGGLPAKKRLLELEGGYGQQSLTF